MWVGDACVWAGRGPGRRGWGDGCLQEVTADLRKGNDHQGSK